jgi:hypothetical protein
VARAPFFEIQIDRTVHSTPSASISNCTRSSAPCWTSSPVGARRPSTATGTTARTARASPVSTQPPPAIAVRTASALAFPAAFSLAQQVPRRVQRARLAQRRMHCHRHSQRQQGEAQGFSVGRRSPRARHVTYPSFFSVSDYLPCPHQQFPSFSSIFFPWLRCAPSEAAALAACTVKSSERCVWLLSLFRQPFLHISISVVTNLVWEEFVLEDGAFHLRNIDFLNHSVFVTNKE